MRQHESRVYSGKKNRAIAPCVIAHRAIAHCAIAHCAIAPCAIAPCVMYHTLRTVRIKCTLCNIAPHAGYATYEPYAPPDIRWFCWRIEKFWMCLFRFLQWFMTGTANWFTQRGERQGIATYRKEEGSDCRMSDMIGDVMMWGEEYQTLLCDTTVIRTRVWVLTLFWALTCM